MKQRDEYIVDEKVHNPRAVNLVCDATLDGKRSLTKAFKNISIQMCHFHPKKIVQRYITMRPKLEAGKDLKRIVSRLTLTTEKSLMNGMSIIKIF